MAREAQRCAQRAAAHLHAVEEPVGFRSPPHEDNMRTLCSAALHASSGRSGSTSVRYRSFSFQVTPKPPPLGARELRAECPRPTLRVSRQKCEET